MSLANFAYIPLSIFLLITPSTTALSVNTQQTNDLPASLQTSTENQFMVGYLTVSWGAMLTISQASSAGYNIVVAAFGVINGANPVQFTNNMFNGYAPWQQITDKTVTDIKNDIITAKTASGLRYVLLSVGGGSNTFKPNGAAPDAIAQQIVDFLHKFTFDGIDFDLEGIAAGYNSSDLVALIQAIKFLDPKLIITCAPQLNAVNNQLDYVNTGTSQVYTDAINQGLFNFIFVQEYNTDINYLNQEGDLWVRPYIEPPAPQPEPPAGYFNETSPEFIVYSFNVLKKITPYSSIIIPGQPATKASAGASIFTGSHQAAPYEAMANSYKQLINDPQFGGAMVWDIGSDYLNNYQYQFIQTIKPAIISVPRLSH